MKTYYIYILECADGLTYTGFTNNIARRFEDHQEGRNKSSFTNKRRLVKLLFYQVFNDVAQAIYFEKKIKKWSAQKKRALASEDFDRLKILAEYRNFTSSKFRATTFEIAERLRELDFEGDSV